MAWPGGSTRTTTTTAAPATLEGIQIRPVDVGVVDVALAAPKSPSYLSLGLQRQSGDIHKQLARRNLPFPAPGKLTGLANGQEANIANDDDQDDNWLFIIITFRRSISMLCLVVLANWKQQQKRNTDTVNTKLATKQRQ